MRRIASAISKIFHPIFSPLLAFLITAVGTKVSVFYRFEQMAYIFAVIFIVTVVFSMLSVIFLKWVGLVSHLEVNVRSERILPLIIGSIFIWGCSAFLNKIHYPISLVLFFRLAVILIVMGTFITLFWKISLHALGWGMLSAISLVINGLNGNSYFFIFPLILLISGIVASARLYLGAHNPMQIYCGYVLGFVGIIFGIAYQSILIHILL